MGRNTYSRSQQNLVIDTTTPYEVFQISGFTTTGNLVSTDNTNMPGESIRSQGVQSVHTHMHYPADMSGLQPSLR